MRRLRSIAVLCAAAALVLAAPLARHAGAADLAVINLINLPADSSGEAYYAQDLGYFKEAGLDVRITPMTNSAAIIAAIAGGGGDVGNAVIGSAADARAKGIPVRFFAPAGLYDSATPTAALVTLKDSPLATAAELKGKVVAVSGLNDLTYYATRDWIDKNGGDSADVRYVELPFPAMAAALQQHRVDAAYIIDPFLTAASKEVRVLGYAASSVAPRYQATGWIATDGWLKSHADLARRFAAVIRKTAIWANGHHKESAAILLRHTKITPAVAATMQRAPYALTLDPRLIQPPIDVEAKYTGQKPMPASELIWQPSP